MKNKDFKPMLIAINKDAKNNFESRKTAFKTILNDFFNEANKFITIQDKNAFKGDFYNTFKRLFEEKYKGQFPEIVTIEKQLELSGINTNKLKFLSDKLNEFLDIDIDLNTNEIKEKDFGIYTTDLNQNKLLIFCKGLIEKIGEAEQFTNVHKGHIIQGFNNLLSYDHSNNSFVPNFYFVTNQIR